MNLIWELLGSVVVLGIGWLLCSSGYEALRTKKTKVKSSTITGWWAQFVGVLLLMIGLPLVLLSIYVVIMLILFYPLISLAAVNKWL